MPCITGLTIEDIRFPTSRELDGSDAMNPDPDYSSAYVVLHTDAPPLEGHGSSFTIGRGNEIVCTAIRAHEHLIVGRTLEEFAANPGGFWHLLNNDSQLRWIGPDKGAVHLALAAIVNALWDLYAKSVGKPLWRLVADFTPEQFVRCVDFRYLTDASRPGRRWLCWSGRRPPRPPVWPGSRPRAILPTPRAPAGWATRTTRSAGFVGKRSPRAGRTSR